MINLLSHTLSLRLYPSNHTPPVWCRLSSMAVTVLLCLSSSPRLFLPPHPDLNDAGWPGWRHASTGTPGKRKGRERRRISAGLGRGGGNDINKKICRGLTVICSYLSVHLALQKRPFVRKKEGWLEGTTPSVNPPIPIYRKPLQKVYFWFEQWG